MHFVQVLTAVHDRYLFAPPDAPKTGPEVYHWSRAVALFNRKLSAPLQPLDREPLWACAALLAIIAFSSVEASTPEEAWPLSGRIPSSPEWLALCQGKKTIWKVANSLKPDGVSSSLVDEYTHPGSQLNLGLNVFRPYYMVLMIRQRPKTIPTILLYIPWPRCSTSTVPSRTLQCFSHS